ncbi:heptaprenyl diphosphate synthase component 1 [Gracilibacillus kekensis]|nr:heptaprenyl diphosphate synthase component 1 [Gracilibacillus kekensis]
MKYIEIIKYYEKLITKSIKQVYLQEHLKHPLIEIHKIVALNELIKSDKKQENLVLTTMLVQIALNTHDQIGNHFDERHSEKEQQLTVLAGDYYSGIYYHILASNNNLSFIRLLADGINEITQKKMHAYYNTYENIDIFLNDYELIEAKLISKVASYVNEKNAIPYISKWLMYKKLQYELVQINNDRKTFYQQLIIETVIGINGKKQLKNTLTYSLEKLDQDLSVMNKHQWSNTLEKDLDLYHISLLQKKGNMTLEEGLSK